jgi:hypothetical protein
VEPEILIVMLSKVGASAAYTELTSCMPVTAAEKEDGNFLNGALRLSELSSFVSKADYYHAHIICKNLPPLYLDLFRLAEEHCKEYRQGKTFPF